MTYTWVEPFAGAAAVALRLVGGRALLPPVAWMGGKRRYARVIADAMGVPPDKPSRVVLADAGPWGWVWPLLLSPLDAALVADVLRGWCKEHPRDLWKRLASVPPYTGPHERAAQWLWLQARSASGVPIWWDGWRTDDERWVSTRPQQAGGVRDAKHAVDTRRWQASDGRSVPRPAGQKSTGWEQGSADGRPGQPAGQRGTWRFDARPSDPTDRVAGQCGGSRSCGGMVNPVTIGGRSLAISQAFNLVDTRVFHGQSEMALSYVRIKPEGELFCYLDPPYIDATGYGWDCPRERVLDIALSFAEEGATVAVSEAEALEISGWHHLEITRPGGKPEWLTISREPVVVPTRQRLLFSEGM